MSQTQLLSFAPEHASLTHCLPHLSWQQLYFPTLSTAKNLRLILVFFSLSVCLSLSVPHEIKSSTFKIKLDYDNFSSTLPCTLVQATIFSY